MYKISLIPAVFKIFLTGIEGIVWQENSKYCAWDVYLTFCLMLNKYIILCRLVPAAKAFFIGYAGEAVPGLLRSLFKPSMS